MFRIGAFARLAGVSAKNSRNGLLVEYYGAAGRAYPAYVSLALLPAMARAVRSRLPALVRVAALLLAVGYVAVALTLFFPFYPPSLAGATFLVNYTAVLCFVLGLALIGVASLIYGRSGTRQKTSTAK